MAAKRAAAKAHAESALTKAEACKVLQVAPTADEELIIKAYWHVARKYRAFAASDPEARRHLDEVNRAYVVLNPGRGEAPLSSELPPVPEVQHWIEDFFRGVRRIIDETAARWPGRTAELAVLAATTAVLGYLALSAGASALWSLLALGVAGLTIWAPWRRI